MPDAMFTISPSPRCPQRRQKGARQQDRCEQVDIDHRPQLVLGDLFQAACAHAAGIVDEPVDAAEHMLGLPHQRFPRGRFPDIALHAVCLHAAVSQQLDRAAELLRTAPGDEHRAPLSPSWRASSKPMPLDPPVITTRLPRTFTSPRPCWP
jgi:hypothetical protein